MKTHDSDRYLDTSAQRLVARRALEGDDRHIACYPDPHEAGTWIVALADDLGELEVIASRDGDDAEERAWARAQRSALIRELPALLWSQDGTVTARAPAPESEVAS